MHARACTFRVKNWIRIAFCERKGGSRARPNTAAVFDAKVDFDHTLTVVASYAVTRIWKFRFLWAGGPDEVFFGCTQIGGGSTAVVVEPALKP
jgi:hypothetical protein